MPRRRRIAQIPGWPFLALVAAGVLHVYYFQHFPPPGAPLNDERVYTAAAARYADDLRSGHAQDILFDGFNSEHPALGKVLYSAGILTDWAVNGNLTFDPNSLISAYDDDSWAQETNARLIRDSRIASAILGVVAVYILARMNAIAGLFLAVSTPMLVYSSAAFLEAPGVLFSTLAVYLISRAARDDTPNSRWLIAAGVAAGMAIASKYYFGIVLAPILYQLGARAGGWRRFVRLCLLFVGVTVLAFGLFDLPFFFNGIAKSSELIRQNGLEYASGWTNESISWPTHWYTEFTLLGLGFRSWFSNPSPFVVVIDPIIGVCGVLGWLVLLRRGSPAAVWLAVALLFLGFYPVKYPQYTMLGVAPLCWTAAHGIQTAVNLARRLVVARVAWPRMLSAGAPIDALSHSNSAVRLP